MFPFHRFKGGIFFCCRPVSIKSICEIDHQYRSRLFDRSRSLFFVWFSRTGSDRPIVQTCPDSSLPFWFCFLFFFNLISGRKMEDVVLTLCCDDIGQCFTSRPTSTKRPSRSSAPAARPWPTPRPTWPNCCGCCRPPPPPASRRRSSCRSTPSSAPSTSPAGRCWNACTASSSPSANGACWSVVLYRVSFVFF